MLPHLLLTLVKLITVPNSLYIILIYLAQFLRTKCTNSNTQYLFEATTLAQGFRFLDDLLLLIDILVHPEVIWLSDAIKNTESLHEGLFARAGVLKELGKDPGSVSYGASTLGI